MKKLIDYLLMTLGCVALASGVYFFEIPNGFVTGSVSGIGMILASLTPLSTGLWISILNSALLILGFIILGRGTGIKTVYCTVLYSALTFGLEFIIPISEPLTDMPLIELVYAILLVAIGCALIFNRGGSSGGTDILALIIRKYSKLDMVAVIFAADLCAVAGAFFIFGIETGLLSFIGLIARSFLVDGVIESFNACKYVVIITTKGDEVTEFITKVLDRGVTVHGVVGGYTGEGKTMLHTVCGRREAIRLRQRIHEIDPSAFTIISTSSEIIGSGFESF